MTSGPIPLMMFSNVTERGGAEEHILQLLRYLDRRYFHLYLVCTPELAESLRPDLPDDVKLATISLDHLTDVTGAEKLMHLLRREQIALVHSHMFRASLFASPLAWLARVPVRIETSHGREVWREDKPWPTSSFSVDRMVCRFVTRMIAVSEATREWLVGRKRIPAEKITVIHTAADLTRFAVPCSPNPGLKRWLGFGDDDPVLLVLGRLEPQKGHRVLIEALPAVLREFPQARVLCLGQGALRAELQAIIDARQLQQHIRLLGYQRNVRDWLAVARMTVLPSFYEGLPLAAIESLAAACPVVATAVDGTPEVVRDARTGLLVPAGDPIRLGEAICTMLRDPQHAHQMAVVGQQHVREQFSVERQGKLTQAFYLQVWKEQMSRTALLPDGARRRHSAEGRAAGGCK